MPASVQNSQQHPLGKSCHGVFRPGPRAEVTGRGAELDLLSLLCSENGDRAQRILPPPWAGAFPAGACVLSARAVETFLSYPPCLCLTVLAARGVGRGISFSV